jgi:hypothetical protein
MAFMKYGKVVGAPAAGDMVVQSGHVGIYVSNGQVLSSGMNARTRRWSPLSLAHCDRSRPFVRAPEPKPAEGPLGRWLGGCVPPVLG